MSECKISLGCIYDKEKGFITLEEHDKQIRKEVIEKVKKYIRLKTKYAEHSNDDYVLAHEMYDWLNEQLKEHK